MNIICVFSPKVKIDNIDIAELRETIRSVTYMTWPKKNSDDGINAYQEFWKRLYHNIMVDAPGGNNVAPEANFIV